MHNYKLKLTRYSEAGALTSETQYINCDTPQQVYDRKKQYEAMRYTSVDQEEKTVVGGKMYKVEPMQCEYVAIADFDKFCDVNKVLR